MATRLESAIARVIAEGRVHTYDMGGKRFHTRRRQSHRRLRQPIIEHLDYSQYEGSVRQNERSNRRLGTSGAIGR